MKFNLGGAGADNINQGVGSIFKALASAPLIRQQAEEQAALRNAQTYSANMAGNKNGAQAEGDQYTLAQRKGVPDMIAGDAAMPDYLKNAYRIFQMTGDTNADRVARSGTEFQTQGIRDKAVDNVGDLDMMNRYNTLAKEGATYEPFKAVGNTGYSINGATGTQGEANPAIAKLFRNIQASVADENAAQASNARASAGQHSASTDKIKEETTRLKAGQSGKGLTAAQLRENAAIQEARDAITGTPQAEIDALLKENPSFMTADQRVKYNIYQRAMKPLFGESDVPAISPIPTPAPPPPEPSRAQKVWSWLTDSDERPEAKSAAAQPAAPKMDAVPSKASAEKIRAAYKAGQITREEAKRQLQSLGFD